MYLANFGSFIGLDADVQLMSGYPTLPDLANACQSLAYDLQSYRLDIPFPAQGVHRHQAVVDMSESSAKSMRRAG